MPAQNHDTTAPEAVGLDTSATSAHRVRVARARFVVATRHLDELSADAQRSPSALVRAAAASQLDGAAEAVRRATAALGLALGPQAGQDDPRGVEPETAPMPIGPAAVAGAL